MTRTLGVESVKYKLLYKNLIMVVIGKYMLVAVIGRGRYGWVSRAKNVELGMNVALKHAPWAFGEECSGGINHTECQHAKDSLWQAALSNEASLLSMISHPAIVSLLDVGKGPTGTMYICLEDLGNTSLAQLVKEKGDPGLSEPLSLVILQQAAEGLSYLHNLGILHRDVKPDNIMIVQDGLNICVKIIDLGLAATWVTEKLLNTSEFRAGTLVYMAPELMRANTAYSNKVDVFSLGASLYFVLFRETPFQEFTRNNIRTTTALFGLQLEHEELLATISHEIALILRSMLNVDPCRRISLVSLLNNCQSASQSLP